MYTGTSLKQKGEVGPMAENLTPLKEWKLGREQNGTAHRKHMAAETQPPPSLEPCFGALVAGIPVGKTALKKARAHFPSHVAGGRLPGLLSGVESLEGSGGWPGQRTPISPRAPCSRLQPPPAGGITLQEEKSF